tara:strand:- start:625 stop:1533 length:909 start_codon:yes stop_codon:yes gene_type:complete
MPIRKHAAFGLILALLPIPAANAAWQESQTGAFRAAYSCDAREETCVAITCEPGRNAKFGIWSTQFAAVSPDDMRQEGRFDVDIDGAASSFPVDDGEYLSDKRVIFWPMDRQLLQDIDSGTTLSLRRWGDPKIDLRDDAGSIGRTLEACTVADSASATAQATDEAPSTASAALWDPASGAARRLSLLKDIMPKNSACTGGGEDASCRAGERPDSDLNSIVAQFDGKSREIIIRAEIAHSIGDHEAYRDRLYDLLAGFGVPQSFVDRCLLQGAVALDAAGQSVRCDSDAPPQSTIATFHIARR